MRLWRPCHPHGEALYVCKMANLQVKCVSIQVNREAWEVVSWGLKLHSYFLHVNPATGLCAARWCGPLALNLDVIRMGLKNAMLSPARGGHQ